MPWSEANKIWWKDYYNNNKERRMALNTRWRKLNPDRVRASAQRHDAKPETKEYKRRWAAKNREKLRARSKRIMFEIRQRVFNGYGGKCSCCGETERAFLSIDHVNNDGAKERREKTGGYGFLSRIVKENFPPRYQILCFNCNWAKSHGGCPHIKKS